jgi:hypothetical protein
MKTRNVLALGALLLTPVFAAGAQFTTVVAPAPAQKEAVAAQVAKAAEVPRDTGRRATLQAMSAWVDSVAGVAAPVGTVSDSVGGDVAADSDSTATPAPAGNTGNTGNSANSGTTRFADGARAPNTASPLPFVLLTGLGAMLVGAWLLVTGRPAAPARAGRSRRAT